MPRASQPGPAQGIASGPTTWGRGISAQVTLQADQVNPVSISTGGGTVSLSVHNGSAGAVAGAACYLFTDSGVYLNMSRTTDAAGAAGFDLVDGSYKIRVDYLGASFWTESFTVPGTESLTLDLGGGTLRLIVDRGSGTPLVGVSTYLFDAAGTYLGISQVTDAQRYFFMREPRMRCDYLYLVLSDANRSPYRQRIERPASAGAVVLAITPVLEPRSDLPHLFTSDGVTRRHSR
jgi:hypothetical protein